MTARSSRSPERHPAGPRLHRDRSAAARRTGRRSRPLRQCAPGPGLARSARHGCAHAAHGPQRGHGRIRRHVDRSARRTGVSGYPGDGAQRWPAVHALDAAVLFRLALESAPAGTSWHAVADEGDAVRDIATVIGRRLELPVETVPQESFGPFGPIFATDQPASSARTRNPRMGADAPEPPRGPGEHPALTGRPPPALSQPTNRPSVRGRRHQTRDSAFGVTAERSICKTVRTQDTARRRAERTASSGLCGLRI